MEENILIKSEKMNLKKFFILLWTVIFTVIGISTAVTLKNYFKYKKAQDSIVYILTLADPKFEEYATYKEKLQAMYDNLNPEYYSYKIENSTISNSDVVKSARDLDIKLGDAIKKAGLGGGFVGSHYLSCPSVISYIATLNRGPTIVSLFFLIIGFYLNMWYIKETKKELTLTEDNIFIKNGKCEIILPIENISSVTSIPIKGVSLFTNEKKQKVCFIENVKGVKQILTEQILNNSLSEEKL